MTQAQRDREAAKAFRAVQDAVMMENMETSRRLASETSAEVMTRAQADLRDIELKIARVVSSVHGVVTKAEIDLRDALREQTGQCYIYGVGFVSLSTVEG